MTTTVCISSQSGLKMLAEGNVTNATVVNRIISSMIQLVPKRMALRVGTYRIMDDT